MFDNIHVSLPREFFILFEISRLIASPGYCSDAMNALNELSEKKHEKTYDKNTSISVDRVDKSAALSDRMEIQNYRTIYDLKKALPRELYWEKKIFNVKLITKTLQVQKHFESDNDKFIPLSYLKDENNHCKARFEQKLYVLLDRSPSMEYRMRSYYSKTIIAEFLRRKLESNAKLFYRSFDSKPGPLFKIEKRDDFSSLMEMVLLTSTGGISTNLQDAIFQAIDDIHFDKEMTDAEILVVTDGIVHDLDIERLRESLKGIRLNIFKIGRDLADPDRNVVKKFLSEAGLDYVDPFSLTIGEIKSMLLNEGDVFRGKGVSPIDKKICSIFLNCSEKIIDDIKTISYRFIEIDDLQPNDIPVINDDTIDLVNDALNELTHNDIKNMTTHEMAIQYKKAFFLSQYIEYLLRSTSGKKIPALVNAAKELSLFKAEMLANPGLYSIINGEKAFRRDNKILKKAKKGATRNYRKMAKQDRKLTKNEIINAEIGFSIGSADGHADSGLFFRILFIKVCEAVKSRFGRLFRIDSAKHNMACLEKARREVTEKTSH